MGDPNGNPDARDAALRSALERLVLLECRAPETPGPILGSTELELCRWRAEAQRAEARAAAAEAQRDRLFGRLIAAERTQASLSGESAGADLASFIAELRSEMGRLELARDAAEAQRAELLEQLRERERTHPADDSPSAWARQLSDQGLLPDPDAPLASLERDLVFGSAAERALLKGILRDLSGPGSDPDSAPDSARGSNQGSARGSNEGSARGSNEGSARGSNEDSARGSNEGSARGSNDELLRESAAERLASLPAALSAPVFAAALSRETSAPVLAKLIRGAGLTRVASLGPLLAPLRAHADPRVRASILFAEVRLTNAAPSDAWLKDADPRVRRRAALAVVLRAPSDAETVLNALGGDANPGVRQSVAAGAAALPQPPATLLLRMAQDVEVRVRRAALRALSAPQSLADLPAAERRKALREILRIQAGADAGASVEPLDAPPAGKGRSPAAPPAVHAAEPASGVPAKELPGLAPETGNPASMDLDVIDQELRSSLRGCTPEQLARLAGVDTDTLNRALKASESRFVMRGPRWFAR